MLSPHLATVDAALRFGPAVGWRPLSVDPSATIAWLPAGCAAVGLFWAARGCFTTDLVRPAARLIAWIGLALGPLVIVQHYSSPTLIYWTFQPLDVDSKTAGPFVNRNHMATWLLLALPTTVGYIVARVAALGDRRSTTPPSVRALEEPRTWWLMGAAVSMLAALITTQSRAGLIGLFAAGATALLAPRATPDRRVSHRWVTAILVAALAVAAALANTGTLLSRFRGAGTDPAGGRVAIWRTTLPIVRDFAVTGVGIGSYATTMLAYQRQARYHFFYNQAHNQYLQFAAEGGLLVGVPILVTLLAFGVAANQALKRDRSPMVWLRVGALAGIVGVAVQSFWETGLRMPANALLCAVVAAIVVYDSRGET